jgi:Putative phage tail protein
MATLILSVAGAAVGGPIGSAVGALIGQQIDQAILGPGKSREGPRIKELQIQTSSYGSQIPAIFGAMRVAGTVIWSTDLIETRKKSGGGKNRPATINYSYSASFAVALSSRAAARVGRIWADGNLLRGAAGDFKTDTQFRFYAGHEDQPLDPLIASAVGTGNCPAFRGLAYAVFEGLQLADYGNRIPSLTFEVFERETPVPVSAIFEAVSEGLITGDSLEQIGGYAVHGNDVGAALSPIANIMPLYVRPDGESLQLVDWFPFSGIVHSGVEIASVGGKSVERPGTVRTAEGKLPRGISIRHFDPSRDYQAGTQQSLQRANAQIVPVVDLPISISASGAKRLADLALLQSVRGREKYRTYRISGATDLRVGDFISRAEGEVRITEIEKFLDFERIEGAGWFRQEPLTATLTDAGVSNPAPDVEIGETRLILADLPALLQVDPGTIQVFAAAAGTGAGWRSANLALRDGINLLDLGGTAPAANMGTLLSPLPAHQSLLIDDSNQPILRLYNESMILPAGTGDPLSQFAPVLWINGEILRYGFAEFLGGSDYRLRHLARGLAGSEHKTGPHLAGTAFLLIEQQSLKLIDPRYVGSGTTIVAEALGLNEQTPIAASLQVEGTATRPFSPVDGRVMRDVNGNMSLSWVRRDRIDAGWNDEVDMPISEDALRFEVLLKAAQARRSPVGLYRTSTSILALARLQGGNFRF